MTTLLLVFTGLAVLIVLAGTMLSEFADALAERTGVGRTMGGLLLLASATSLPELSVDCKAALIGQPDIAVGAVLGSSVFNLLILGMLDLVFVRRETIISPASKDHTLSALGTLILTAIAVASLVLKDLPVELSLFGVVTFGCGSFAAFVFYMYCLRLVYNDQRQRLRLGAGADVGRRSSHSAGEQEVETTTAEATLFVNPSRLSMRRAVIGYCLSTLVILIAGSYLAPTADRLAEVTNLGGTFIGSTMIALTTSLPELVTTLAAVRMGAIDMAVGNILGSNAFNVAILFPVDMFYRHGSGSVLKDAEVSNALTGSAVILITSVVLLAFFYHPVRRNRWLDPGAGLVVVISAACFVALYYLTPAAH